MDASDRRHGKRAGYIAGCHDECCRVPHLRYQKQSNLRRHREGSQYLGNERVLARLAWWSRYGVTPCAIATAAGLSDSTLVATQTEGLRVTKATERATLAVTWDDLHAESLVYAELTKLRIYSAMASGHTLHGLLGQIGRMPKTGNWRTQERVSVGLARAVQALYDQTPAFGPSLHTANRTKNQGWPVMAAWDDPGTPAAPKGWWPDTCEDYRPPTRAELVDHLVECGAGIDEVARRLGIEVDSLRAWCKRNGRLGTWAQMQERSAA